MKDKKKNKKDIKRLMGKAGIILTAILAGLLCGWLLGAVLDKTGAGQAGSRADFCSGSFILCF